MKKLVILGFLWMGMPFSMAAGPENKATHTIQPEEITAKVREKLSPLVQAALEKHCGEDCPSFKIETQFKKSLTQDVLEDLGFSQSSPEPSNPELQSIHISILVHDQVPKASQEALKQILTHITNNEAPVPTQVQLKSLNGLSPSLEKKSRPKKEEASLPEDHRMEIFQTLVWPVSLFFLALIGILGLALFLKNRRDLIRDQQLSQISTKEGTLGTKEEKGTPASLEAARLLETRSNDLLWFIEDLALQGDMKSLGKIVSIYQPQDLSTQLKISKQALKALSSLSDSRQKVSANESFPWLKESLNRAHWKRLEEQNFPLAKFARLSDQQRSLVFTKLNSENEKAALLSTLPIENWPLLLSQTSSDERIRLGLALSLYQNSTLESRIHLETSLSSHMNEIMDSSTVSSEKLMDTFTLYLTESEAKELWQELSKKNSAQAKKPAMLSIDAWVQELDPKAAVEIFTSLELDSLGALVHQLSDQTKQKVLLSLPKTLRDRLSTLNQTPSEAQLMKSRVQMMDAYRRFTSGGLVQ